MLDKRVTIRLDGERFAFLERLAQREGFTVSLIIRHLVMRYVEREQRETGGLL